MIRPADYPLQTLNLNTTKDLLADWPACPDCTNPMRSYTGNINHSDRFGLSQRRIFGWCDICNCGYELEQFYKLARWRTSRFRKFRVTPRGKPKAQKWQRITDLPVAIVRVGPAKEYDSKYYD